ncbi:MAG: hypothetical protein CBD39_01905 [Flavobacteriaceae bacterium TMED179]|nr:MAG: hypothetical protein CBD39_01905 [Flavobacteriaceae bacterium TMED179]|tara:strand:+ start:6910 stop:7521 length:612 start_codon:yes stop_codon:yes gene_type:complete
MIEALCPAYLPNAEYFSWLLKQSTVFFTGDSLYQKQTFRNRTMIYGANGELKLIIPIRHNQKNTKPLDIEIQISYDMKWQNQHWKSICSSYRSSPFFEFYEDEIAEFYKEKRESLFMFNLSLLVKLMMLLEEPFEYKIISFENDIYKRLDSLITPKIKSQTIFETYTQVFSSKHGFISNLSILDILFNLGPNSSNYLKNISLK